MGLATRIFTWWLDNTIGTTWFTSRHGRQVGEDQFGNRYFQEKQPARDPQIARGGAGLSAKHGRRWVLYNGEPEASKVPPEWHAWLHHMVDDVPQPRQRHPWEKDHQPNLTGTPLAYHPRGSVLRGGHRVAATGDYEPWSPQ